MFWWVHRYGIGCHVRMAQIPLAVTLRKQRPEGNKSTIKVNLWAPLLMELYDNARTPTSKTKRSAVFSMTTTQHRGCNM